MTTSKFYSIDDSPGYGTMINLLEGWGWERSSLVHAQVVVFNGGADIGTSIYGEKPIYRGIPHLPSERDRREIGIFNRYVHQKLFVGICRGAQFLNCMSGGTLWQDVNNHTRSHNMRDEITGDIIEVTSTHHQMMRPGPGGLVIGTADEATKKEAHPDQMGYQPFSDTEIVWYQSTGCLCIQGHPEYVPNSRFAEYSQTLINNYLEKANS